MSDILKNKNIPAKILKNIFIDDAVAEQKKSRAAEDELNKGKRGTIATPQQICGYRRRVESVIINKMDEWADPKIRALKIVGYHTMIKNISKREKEANLKRKAHRGRRSQASINRRTNRKQMA